VLSVARLSPPVSRPEPSGSSPSPLVLLDPNRPEDLVELGTVPGLAIYSGTWVRGAIPS
jgi:hypothetical protein